MMRRNGIVRVPKLWLDVVTEAFFDLRAKGESRVEIPLPLNVFPYPKIRTALLAIYPQKFVPLLFKVGSGSAEGTTGKHYTGKGYVVEINKTSSASSASKISTILHELRHVVQYLGDEVVKTKSGTFGRPSVAATRSLRARKKAIKSGKIKATKFQAYLSGASEWQPWVGSTADKIVGSITYGKLTTTKQVNDAIRTGILGSTFYANTDPATRKELMRQVYTEVVRQLRGYTDIVPAKHPKASVGLATAKASAPKVSAEKVVKVKVPKSLTSAPHSVRIKIEGASPSIANEPNYTGKDSKGRDTLTMDFDTQNPALVLAFEIRDQAKKGATLHGGKVYAVRVRSKGSPEAEIYKANPRRTRRALRRRR